MEEVAMNRTAKHRKVGATAEVVAVAGAYIVISTTAIAALDASFLFPANWPAPERATGSSFLIGAVVQLLLVLVGAYLVGLKDLREAIANTFKRSSREAWVIAGIATAIHIGTGVLAFLPDAREVWELSSRNLVLSLVCSPDGWSQEVLFRGYVIYRLARATVAPATQILLSGALFAAIHFGYAGDTAWTIIAPLVGTFVLGCFYAWAVRRGGGSLKPVVCCHILIVIVLQPWLALAS
jgi:hypothetical protein